MSNARHIKYAGKSFIAKSGETFTVNSVDNDGFMFISFDEMPDILLKYKFRTPKDGMPLKNYMARNVYGVGYLGPRYSEGKVDEVAHRRWRGMLGRCYSDAWDMKERATVCEDWLCFQNFYDWFSKFEDKSKYWHIDKDLECAMMYSPDTVHYIPESINLQITILNNAVKRLKEKYHLISSKSVLTSFIQIKEELEINKPHMEQRTVNRLTKLLTDTHPVCIEVLKLDR